MRKFFVLFATIALLVAAVVPSFAQDDEPGTIADIVVASTEAEEAEFTILLTAIQAADPLVLEALSDPEGEFTVFAPTDAAFEALIEELGEEEFNAIVADTEVLTDILLYHVVAGAVPSEAVVELDGQEVITLWGDMMMMDDMDDMDEDMDDMEEDMEEEDMEEDMSEEDMADEDMDDMDDDMMDMMPMDPFAVLITVTEEGGVMVNNANVVTVDIEASNGIIHVIDTVLVPLFDMMMMDDMDDMEEEGEGEGS